MEIEKKNITNTFSLPILDSAQLLKTLPTQNKNSLIAFISGVQLCDDGKSRFFQICDFLSGKLQSDEYNRVLNGIHSLVLIGDFVKQEKQPNLSLISSFKYGKDFQKIFRSMALQLKKLDGALSHVTQLKEVFLFPGPNDCTDSYYPQSPLSPVLLPKSRGSEALNLCSNPAEVKLGEKSFLVTSGANVRNVRDYSLVRLYFILEHAKR